MDTKDFIQLAKKRMSTVVAIMLIFLVVGLAITLAQPLKYRSKSRLLILQPNTAADAYAVARSNQYVGGLISEVIYSGAFLDSLATSNFSFDRNYFNGTYKQNIKKWKKTVFAKSGGDTGVIDIEIYHTNPEEAKKISLAVNQLIISGQSPYKFNSNQTKISIIDQPVVSSFPVKPNVPLNMAASLLFGFLSGCSYIYLFPQKRLSEKLAQKLLAKEEKIRFQESTPVWQPLNNIPIQEPAPSYQAFVPENLPIFTKEEAEHIQPVETMEAKPAFKNQFIFQGNIRNVLGE